MNIIKDLKKLIKEDNYKGFLEIIYFCDNQKDIEKMLANNFVCDYMLKKAKECKKNPELEAIRRGVIDASIARYKEKK